MEKLHFMNIIWSDCTIVESEGKFALIDTGEVSKEDKTLPYFEKLGIKEFEFVYITHFHRDHYQGLFKILERYHVKKVYIKKYSGVDGDDGSGNKASNEYHEHTMNDFNTLCEMAKKQGELEIVNEDTNDLVCGKFCFKVFRKGNYLNEIYEDASNPKYYHSMVLSENYNSSVLYTSVNGANIYIGGDITDNTHECELISRANFKVLRELNCQMDIYKVAHHGTIGCHSEESLNILRPKNAIITNSYFYLERWNTQNELLESNPECKIYTTEKKYIIYTIGQDGKVTYELKTLEEM